MEGNMKWTVGEGQVCGMARSGIRGSRMWGNGNQRSDMAGVGQGGSVAMAWRDLLWRWKLLAGGEDEWWIWKAMRTQGDHTASNSKCDEDETAAPTQSPPIWPVSCPLPGLYLGGACGRARHGAGS